MEHQHEHQRIEELDTPTILLDLNKMEKNVDEIARFAKSHGIHWRPHIKTHKSVRIAQHQLTEGAVGITVAKMSEAVVMATAGITDILVAYPIFSPCKMDKIAPWLDRIQLKIAVDSVDQANALQDDMVSRSQRLEVWIKVNSGLNRCGVEPGKPTVELAKQLSRLPNLNLGGILTHAGHSYGASSIEEIERIGRYEGECVVESAELCEQAGIPIPVRSVGSTPTFRFAGKVPGITEIRPGNAVFYDASQSGLGVATIEQCALSVLASVVHVTEGDRVVLDTGSKSLSLDQGAHGNQSVRGFGHVMGHPEMTIERLSEEHGVVPWNGKMDVRLGDKLQIIPNHACTVMNLFDRVTTHRNGIVIEDWPVDARGKVQ